MHCDREKSQKKEKSRSWYGFSSQMYGDWKRVENESF